MPRAPTVSDDDCLLAVYGTLMQRSGDVLERLGLTAQVVAHGACRVPGRLVDLQAYPGWLPGDGEVHAELLEIRDPAAWSVLDDFEDCHPLPPAAPEYRRERVRLVEPSGRSAWIYRYIGPQSDAPTVPGGDWWAHARHRGNAWSGVAGRAARSAA